ncbi:polyhydroxyalkanoic acid system family protein [Azospirillum halopraeferens]|uniref:polyhydroxyalkanoic acid system family protein n=1 Tax=Azospirillum halopraeferens TaxID=34010 RepID=UPI0003F54F48|nr:polyhydroxyalkanoic acid system family protein [Azospirillum halopraeferens]
MPKPVIVTIPHQLGREAATQRLRDGLDKARAQLSGVNAVVEETWTADGMDLRIVAVGQTVNGRIIVAEEHVRVEVDLPWVLAMLAEKVGHRIRHHGALLLTKS